MRQIPIPEEFLGRPFTVAEALAHGLSEQALRGSRFRRVFRGVYVCTQPGLADLSFETCLEAGRLVVGGAPATHTTGLRCHGVPIGPILPVCFATEGDHASRRDGIRLIRRMRVARHEQGAALSPEQCWVDACLDLDLVDAVIAADWLIRLGGTTLARLTRFVEATDNWEGIRKARLALPYVRENVRSPRETLIRLMFELAGLPAPQCNRDVYAEDRFLGCADLIWWAYRVIAEYDGRQHAEDIAQWNRDVDRHDDFADGGWAFVRVTNQRLRAPRTVVRNVHAKLVAGGYTGPEPVFDDQWARLFERRPAHRR